MIGLLIKLTASLQLSPDVVPQPPRRRIESL
jgi:hypothetical protein